MSGDFTKELEAADDAAAKLIKALALCGEMGVFTRTGGKHDVRVIGHHGQCNAQAAMLRAAAEQIEALGRTPEGHTLQ